MVEKPGSVSGAPAITSASVLRGGVPPGSARSTLSGGGARTGTARIGCSGWSYDHWRGVVYPHDVRRSAWFEHYSSLFDTVEINATFYRLPSARAVEEWRRRAPDGFVYAAKLGAFGSHRMKLRDAESWLPSHLDRVRRLGLALGPTLVQLPPRWRRDAGRLAGFLDVACTLAPDVRWAVEVRDPSWLHASVYSVLYEHGAALCVHDILPDHPWLITTDWVYVRFHGPSAAGSEKYTGRYGGRRLWRRARLIATALDDGLDAYAYFNNDRGGDAVADARWLAGRLTPGRASL